MAGGSSYNGWPASDDPNAIDVDPGFRAAGCAFPGGARAGDVSTVLGYVIDQVAARVEPPLINPDTGAPGYGCWGFNYRANVNNPSTLSCHSSATALDWNAPAHPNGAHGTFSDAQRATIYDILAEVGGAVQWGGDYSGTVDEMHFEIIVDAGTLAQVAAGLAGGGYQPDGADDMPLTDEDVDKIADRVWSQIITEAQDQPAWKLLMDARDVMASVPAALDPQTVADAIAQTRNDVGQIKAQL
jgi:D-alanyl-D-alanine carboxypeptidase